MTRPARHPHISWRVPVTPSTSGSFFDRENSRWAASGEIRANAFLRSNADLDGTVVLDDGHPVELAEQHQTLRALLLRRTGLSGFLWRRPTPRASHRRHLDSGHVGADAEGRTRQRGFDHHHYT